MDAEQLAAALFAVMPNTVKAKIIEGPEHTLQVAPTPESFAGVRLFDAVATAGGKLTTEGCDWWIDGKELHGKVTDPFVIINTLNSPRKRD